MLETKNSFNVCQSALYTCCCSVSQSCLTLCDPMGCSSSGFPDLHFSWNLLKLMSIESVMSSNHLFLCHTLLLLPLIFPSIRVFSSESAPCIMWPKYWSFSFSISPSNEYSEFISFEVKWKSLSLVWLFAAHDLYNPWNSPGQNTGVGKLSLLQGIFPTQGSNPGLPHCRWFLYQLKLSHKGSISFSNWLIDLLAVQGTPKSPSTTIKSINSSALSLLYGPTLTSICDYWKNQNSGKDCYFLLQGIFPNQW